MYSIYDTDDVTEDTEEVDGGQFCGSFKDAVKFAGEHALEVASRLNPSEEVSCCGSCDEEEEITK